MSEEWLVGLNAVQSALENDAGNLREVLVDRERKDGRVRPGAYWNWPPGWIRKIP